AQLPRSHGDPLPAGPLAHLVRGLLLHARGARGLGGSESHDDLQGAPSGVREARAHGVGGVPRADGEPGASRRAQAQEVERFVVVSDAPELAGPPVFLVGAERSGTTLLRLMLDQHPELAFQFEFELAVDHLPDARDWPPVAEYLARLRSDRIFLLSGYEAD